MVYAYSHLLPYLAASVAASEHDLFIATRLLLDSISQAHYYWDRPVIAFATACVNVVHAVVNCISLSSNPCYAFVLEMMVLGLLLGWAIFDCCLQFLIDFSQTHRAVVLSVNTFHCCPTIAPPLDKLSDRVSSSVALFSNDQKRKNWETELTVCSLLTHLISCRSTDK